MFIRFCAFCIGVCLSILTGTTAALAYYTDAPHNEANGIYCQTCHADPAYSFHEPSNIDDTLENVICLRCHGSQGVSPQHKLHSDLTINGTENWTTSCIDCHDPHFQDNVRAWAGIDANAFLVTGTIGTITATTPADSQENAAYPDGTTTISYNLANAQLNWNDPAKWASKGGYCNPETAIDNSRGLIFIRNYMALGDTFEIVAADNSTITLKGQMAPAVGLKFALVYGQLIRSYMLDANGNGGKYIKLFSPINGAGIDNGFIDNSGASEPIGICQVCHPQTMKYWNTDNSGNAAIAQPHGQNFPCSSCHKHAAGFASGTDHGQFMSDSNNCLGCHTTYNEVETGHPLCDSCHTTATPYMNNLPVKYEAKGVHDALAVSYSFDANDRLHDANGIDIHDPPNFISITCLTCHIEKSDWQHHDPNNETHPVNVLATTDNTCETCHGGLAWPYSNPTQVHYNNGVSCDLCHNSVDGSFIGSAASHTLGLASNCRKCHGTKHDPAPAHTAVYEGGQKKISEPATLGGCTNISCHGGEGFGSNGNQADIQSGHLNRKTVTFPQGMDCQSCHTAGSKLDDANVAAVIAAASTTATPAIPPACADCHGAQEAPHGMTDHTVAGGTGYIPITVNQECITCHTTYTAPGSAHITSCATCHTTGEDLRNTPDLVQFAGSPTACTDCHTVPGVKQHGMTPADVGAIHTISSSSAMNCVSCHSTMGNGVGQLTDHMYRSNDCQTCHGAATATSGANAVNIIATATNPDTNHAVTCEQCHAATGDYRLHGMSIVDVGSRHDISSTDCQSCHDNMADGLSQLNRHMTSGDCLTCHNAADTTNGASATDVILKATMRNPGLLPGETDTNAPVTCEQCHVVKGDYKLHGLSVTDSHDAHNNTVYEDSPSQETVESGNCGNCHAAFMSPNLAMNHIALPTTSYPFGMNCQSCHNYTGSKLKMDIRAVIDAGIAANTNPAPASCADCHEARTDLHPATPANDHLGIANNGYAPIIADAECSACHSDNITQIHLYTCSTCHSSNMPDLAATPFTLNQFAGSSTSCQDCHNQAIFPAIKAHGLTAAEVGGRHNIPATTCQGCHNDMLSGEEQLNGHMPAGDCMQCHGAVDTANNTSATAIITAATAPLDNLPVDCAQCHALKGDYKLHGLDASTTADIHDNTGFETTPALTCTNCHTDMTAIVSGHLDLTATATFTGGMTCVDCHNYTGGKLLKNEINTAIANAKTSATSPVTALCADCHGGTRPTDHPNIDHTVIGLNGYIPLTADSQCINCHGGDMVVDVHANTCTTCHSNAIPGLSTSPFALGQFSGSSTSCTDCHNAITFLTIKEHGLTPATVGARHNMTSANCQGCHTDMADGASELNLHMPLGNCLLCHGAANTSNNTSATGVIATATAPEVNLVVTCEDCHAAKGDYKLHGLTLTDTTDIHSNTDYEDVPSQELVQNGQCAGCHAAFTSPNLAISHFAMSSTPSYSTGMDCFSCHNFSAGPTATISKSWVDATIAAGVKSNPAATLASCADCHGAQADPHPTTPTNDHLDVNASGYAPITVNAECVNCHTGGISHIHSYNCQSCHDATMPYLSNSPHNLTQFAGSTTTCLDCHDSANVPGIKEHGISSNEVGSRHKIISANCQNCHDNMADGIQQLDRHMILTNDCLTCHQAATATSGASAIDQIAAAIAPQTNTQVSCEQCHAAKGDYRLHGLTTADTIDIHNNTHTLTSTPASEVNNPNLNCATCHNDMAAPGLSAGHIGLPNVTSYPNGMDCQSCHNYTEGGKTNMTRVAIDTAIAAGLSDQAGDLVECAACHEPLPPDHGGHPTPDTFIQPDTNCTACHDSQEDRDYITDIHNRRAASRNLTNCQVCHQNPNGGVSLQDYSTSGGVLIPNDKVNYISRTNGNGGTCLICHNNSGGGATVAFSQTDDFSNLSTGQAAGASFGNWTEVTDINGSAQWMIWTGATNSAGTGPSSSSGGYVVLESSPATAACTVDPAGTYIEAENFENNIVPGIYNWQAIVNAGIGANNAGYLLTTSGATALSPQGAQANYSVVIPADGTYQIRMRVQDGAWNGSGGDSTMWGVDGTLVGIITETTVGTWTWTSNEHAPSNKVFLSKGVHTINLWPRELDQRTDAFVIWDTANAAPVSEGDTGTTIPAGITQLNPTNCGSTGDADVTNGSDALAADSNQYLESNTFDASQYISLSINFAYNMNIADNSDAVLSVAGWDGTVWHTSQIKTGSSGDIWQSSGTVDFIGYSNSDFKIRIAYKTGTGTLYQNDIGIDNIIISGDLNTIGDGSRYHPAFIHNTIGDNTANCTTTCHTETNSITGIHKVSGIDSTDCYKCHQSADPTVILAIYNGSDGATQTCGNCHGSYNNDFRNSHTVIGDTHAAMILPNGASQPDCSVEFCHSGNVQTEVHANQCGLCHVDVDNNIGTLQGTALNHTVGTPSTCSDCHIGRDDDHTAEHDNARYEDTPSLKEDTTAANSVSGQCDSCHSFMGYNGSGYANISTAHVGLVIASREITIGENNEDASGAMTCATCHRSQIPVVVNTIAAGRSSATSPANASCADCHGPRSLPHGGHDYTHFGSDGNCADCHTGTSVTADIHNNDCLLCHDNASGGDETTVIEGDPTNGIDGDARQASNLTDFTTATCSTCHDGAAATNTSIDAHHGASKNNYYANEQCASCHVNSGTEHDNTDYEDNPSQEDTNIQNCADCHELFSNLPNGHVGRSVLTNDFGTPVGAEIDCMSCHGSSTEPVPTIISNAAGANPTEIPASCADCHAPRTVPHGGHLPDHFGGSSQCTGCHIVTSAGITEDFHQCEDCHLVTTAGYGAVKVGDSAGGTNGDATRAAALADYRTATCLTCHGPYMTVTTTEAAGGNNSVTTYGGAHHNEPHTQAGDCDYCHDDPRRGPDTDWETTFGLTTCPPTLPKQLACIGCHVQGGVNQTSGLQIYEQAYQWAGTAERSKINAVVNVQIVHQINSLSNQPIKVYNYGICLGCHNQDQKGRRINVLHARPVATNMWANGTDNKKQGSTQIDNLLKAAGFNNFRVFSDDKDRSLYPAIRGGIGNLKDKYDKIYKDDDKLADYVKSLKPGAPKAPYDMNITVPCGSFNDWEGQCKQVGSSTTVKLPYFSDIAAPGPFGPNANNDNYTVDINSTTTLNITANDTGIGISLQSIGSATGNLQKSGNSVLYTPVTGHLSTDSFSYTIVDTDGVTASGSVAITIVDPTINTPPVAGDDSIAVAKDSSNNIINVLANDSDPDSDPFTVSAITSQAAHGTCTSQTTTVNYTPTAGYTGSDSCSYQISDGQGGTAVAIISITVNNGTLASASGNTVGGITPFANYSSADSVTIDVNTLNNNAGDKKNEWFIFDDGDNNELCAGKFSKISADNWRANIDFAGCNLNDGLYFMEMAIEDDNTGEKFKIKFIPFTIGNTSEYIRVYSDDKYTNETTVFASNARVYVEINSAAFDKKINASPDAGGSEVKVASFKDTKYVDKANFKSFTYEGGVKYRLSFDLATNTGTNYPSGGYLYQAEMKANGNSKTGVILQVN